MVWETYSTSSWSKVRRGVPTHHILPSKTHLDCDRYGPPQSQPWMTSPRFAEGHDIGANERDPAIMLRTRKKIARAIENSTHLLELE